MNNEFFFITVFFQGIASFLSPCVLPLIPAYLTYMTGQSVEVMVKEPKAQRALVFNSLAFVLGFSVVFVSLGMVATSLGQFLQANRDFIRKASGILIVFFGLFHTGLIPVSFLNYEKRLKVNPGAPGLWASFLIGVGFSFGWSPCIGPILTSVYIMASQAETLVTGMFLLIAYALGLGVPFIVVAISLKGIWKYIQGMNRYISLIKVVSGLLLVAVGIMIYLNAFYFLYGN